MQTSDIGKRIRLIRRSRGESLVQLSRAINIDRSYLNKIELGTIKPSQKLLDRLIVHFSLEGNDADNLKSHLTGITASGDTSEDGRKEVKVLNENANNVIGMMPTTQVAINPMNTPVLYTDSTFVSATEFGIVLDVGQTMNGGQQQNIVTRIGMSFDHANKLVEVLKDTLEKNER